MRELWARARNCWNKILAHEGGSILVVAHNAVNQALVATAIGTILFCAASLCGCIEKLFFGCSFEHVAPLNFFLFYLLNNQD